MNTSGLTKIVKTVQKAAKKHSPEILTGLGIAGMVTTVIMAVKATPKALQKIEEAGEERYKNDMENETFTPMTTVDKVKVAWRCYVPAAVVGVASIGCLVGASSVNVRRNAALATAYALSESTLKEYQEKVVEQIGEKKEREVRDAIAKDYVDKNPIENTPIIITEKGNTLCLDKLTGRYFKSDMDTLKKAENELARQMRYDSYVSLNEFYDLIGLDHIDIGYDLGWNIDRGYIELEFSSQLASDGTPCLVMSYRVAPQYDYSR